MGSRSCKVPYGSAFVTCTKVIKVKVGGTEIRLMAGMNTTINGVQIMHRTLQKHRGDLHQGHQGEGRWDLMAGMNTTINGVQMMQSTLRKRRGDLHQGHQGEGRWDGDPPDS